MKLFNNHSEDTFAEPLKTTEELRVYETYRNMQDALVNKDLGTLDQIIANGTTIGHISGRTQSKDQYLSDIREGVFAYYKIRLSDIRVTVTEDTAELTCVNFMRAKVYGMRGVIPLRVTAKFVNVDGEWKYTESPGPKLGRQ